LTISTAAIAPAPFRIAPRRSPADNVVELCRNVARNFQPQPSQATVRSATRTLPLVSGLNNTATRKMANPTTVVTRIGPDRLIWWVVAYQTSNGEINPPQIAPW